MIIYKITNLINNKIYVGQSININNSYYGSGIRIINAIKKYGKQNFKKDILCECSSIEELNEKEMFWINKLDSRKNGYNISYGGKGKGTCSEETKRKISASRKGIKHSQEAKKKMSLSQTGKKLSIETKNKMSISRKGHVGYMKGKKHSIETKEKMKIAHLGKECYWKNNKYPESAKQKLSEKFKGRIFTDEWKKKLSIAKKNISEESRKRISESAKNRKNKITDEEKRLMVQLIKTYGIKDAIKNSTWSRSTFYKINKEKSVTI